MSSFSYREAPWPVREDIPKAYQVYWQKLASPGSWWTGAERVAIATESRSALTCAFCKARKKALSPYTFEGLHQQRSDLPAVAVDAVHRIITDQGRITQAWVNDNVTRGMTKEAYVELVGVVVTVFSIDEFHRALGLLIEPLPTPTPGEISRYRPAVVREDIGFVPTVPADGNVGQESDIWDGVRAANVLRALTLVPQTFKDWRAIGDVQYLTFEGMGNFVKDAHRTINRMQMELIAGRVSSINECFY
jgi:hypothetical protein